VSDKFWVGVAVNTQEKSWIFAGDHESELGAVKKAKDDCPGSSVFAIGLEGEVSMGRIHDQCIQRMAEIDIIGVEAVAIADSIVESLTEMVEDIEAEEGHPNDECLWFAGMALSNVNVADLTEEERDRLIIHAMSCERCGAFVDNIAEAMREEDFGISPAKIRESKRLAQETLERLAKKGQL
jgi:hypothetical protein